MQTSPWWFHWWFRGVVAGTLLSVVGLVALADGVEDQYKQRFRKLAADDIEGHYKLALWCKEQKAFTLLKTQCTYILRKSKNHEPARLLLELARREMAAGAPPGAGPAGRGKPRLAALGRILNDDEIQILRRSELLLDRPERVGVKFKNRVLERFFAEMQGGPGFGFTRQRFFKLPPSERAQLILDFAPEAYGRDVEITTDPQRFANFERKVLPIVLEGCATATCHGTHGRARWRLYSDRVRSKNMVYTNYLIMHELTLGQERLIDRDLPDRSLVLVYGLPEATTGPDHPSNHPQPIDPPFRNPKDRKYLEVLDWIESLALPTPDYGIVLEPPNSPK